MNQELPPLPSWPERWQATLGWQPDAGQQLQFEQIYAEVLTANQHLNLTRITAPEDFWEKHLWDSLRGIAPLQELGAQRVIDIGTGAGFPGLPVAVAHPDWLVTLLDATQKKIAFLETLLQQVGLANCHTLVGRAEAIGKQKQGAYDLALVRAVGPADRCARYALPLLRPGGLAILYRGQWTAEEADVLQIALQEFDGVLEQIDAFTTPLTQGVRHCIHIKRSS
ncbi:16S rRNA (guanine(527)-N(7))-methyltransferase RsmG [Leptolyngbya sp. FACHB-261]|uniref:16S rRNA (guanine(527)-N(7))-methyltransferase RsmG n=1 Tax=Leptolyngbya sp. FACHB-261 TaxID=2692806 RepID=UPI001686FB68|nr:16S rRNA (guanine(527)-N(7))-methyltransferase RsmG [Leptolyngbya sp. FACHB-261]MBD2101597.1 16S rRNA (guanine(527)-N(7))-methyltransferase RsmG [Leptolyngbya sp. FACHB-261]